MVKEIYQPELYKRKRIPVEQQYITSSYLTDNLIEALRRPYRLLENIPINELFINTHTHNEYVADGSDYDADETRLGRLIDELEDLNVDKYDIMETLDELIERHDNLLLDDNNEDQALLNRCWDNVTQKQWEYDKISKDIQRVKNLIQKLENGDTTD